MNFNYRALVVTTHISNLFNFQNNKITTVSAFVVVFWFDLMFLKWKWKCNSNNFMPNYFHQSIKNYGVFEKVFCSKVSGTEWSHSWVIKRNIGIMCAVAIGKVKKKEI